MNPSGKKGDAMFVVVIALPPIKEGKDAQFREWFAASNEEFSRFKGFIRRRLLKPLHGGNYAAIVEFDDEEAFKALHGSTAHDKACQLAVSLFDGSPTPQFFEVLEG